jgi:predicted ATPase/class 3 adenylate cyclase
MDVARHELPAGTVTFVFTDIEGSTRLMRALGDRYAEVLDRHREILRESWARHGGHEVDTEGDAFFVAFGDAAAAVRACVDGQRELAGERWAADARVRVRMGVHTGVAVPRGRDYVAFAVHQAARVIDTGHGGQIVLSGDTATGLVVGNGITLRSLGRYRVRDFDEPVELWQVHADGIEDTFPALRVPPADHHNLTAPPTPIIGRDAELEHLRATVRAGRAVSVVGPGGVGKTRLAVEHGLRSLDEWPDGIWFVDLAAIDDGALVAVTVASSLGVRAAADSDALPEVVEHLQRVQALLILDNVEHVREATARVVAAILARSTRVGILLTSREPIAWRGETVVRVGPLQWTGVDTGRTPAVQLFLARAAEAGSTRDDDPGAIAALCRRLDGLPLAIEMAAARATLLAPAEILAGIDESGSVASRDPTMSERHRSLDHLLAWSDRLLTDEERLVMRRLSVFAGAFGYESAAAASATQEIATAVVPDAIWSLANKSLLYSDPTAGATRYRFPETVRTYARRHDPDREAPAAARRLAPWYLARIGPTCALDRAWVARMADELENLRGLIPLISSDAPADAQCLAWSIGRYHDVVQAYRTGIEEVERYAAELTAATPARVALLTLLADLHLRVGDSGRGADVLAGARDLQNAVGPPAWDDAAVDRTDGELALRGGDHERAVRLAEEVLGRSLSDRGQGRMWNLLGIARSSVGDHAGSATAFEQELAAWQRLGLEALQASTHGNVAEALLRAGDRAGAARHQRQCLRLALWYGQPVMVAYSLMVAARLAVDAARWQPAVRLQTAADQQLGSLGHAMYDEDRAVADAVISAAAERLSASEMDEERRRAARDDLNTLVALADELFRNSEETHEMETHA